MEKVFEIRAWIYGLAIISNANFIRIKKQHKIRSKKMLTYFGKHNEIGMDFIHQGAIIPIGNINNYSYTIFCGNKGDNRYSDTWNIVKRLGSFNLSIDNDNCFWVMQINKLENWSDDKLNDHEFLTEEVYINNKLTEVYRAVKVPFTKGLYSITIYGLKRKNPNPGNIGETTNYGFYFELDPTDTLSSMEDPTTTDFKCYD